MMWGADAARKHAETQFGSSRGNLLPAQGCLAAERHRREGRNWKTVRCAEGIVQRGFLDMDIPLDATREGVALPGTGSVASPP